MKMAVLIGVENELTSYRALKVNKIYYFSIYLHDWNENDCQTKSHLFVCLFVCLWNVSCWQWDF